MTVSTSATPEVESAFKPTPDQLQREAALKRFNRLFVYTPMALVGFLIIGLLIFMLWQVFTTPPNSESSNFYPLISGLADLILIFNLLPMMLLCLTGPALLFFLLRSSYKHRQLEPPQNRNKLQVLIWRVDSFLTTLHNNLRDSYLEKGVKPLIVGHSLTAAIQAVARYIQNIFWTRKE